MSFGVSFSCLLLLRHEPKEVAGPGYVAAIRKMDMSRIAKIIALIVALAMFVFSVWVYNNTGDWVAIVFALGSVAYAIYFFTTLSGKDS